MLLSKHKLLFYAALALLLVAKVTKTVGVAIPPPPTNAAQVWYAPSATTCENFREFSQVS